MPSETLIEPGMTPVPARSAASRTSTTRVLGSSWIFFWASCGLSAGVPWRPSSTICRDVFAIVFSSCRDGARPRPWIVPEARSRGSAVVDVERGGHPDRRIGRGCRRLEGPGAVPEDLARVHDVLRVERPLDPAHHVQGRSVLAGHVRSPRHPDAMLAGGGAAHPQGKLVDLVG